MGRPHKNTLLLLAIAAGVVSLTVTWMTVQWNAMRLAFFDTAVYVDAVNGTLGFKEPIYFMVSDYKDWGPPIWWFVAIAIAASVLQLLNHNSKAFAVPALIEWLFPLAPIACFAGAMAWGFTDHRATPQIGIYLGLAAAVIPFLCLVIPTRKTG